MKGRGSKRFIDNSKLIYGKISSPSRVRVEESGGGIKPIIFTGSYG